MSQKKYPSNIIVYTNNIKSTRPIKFFDDHNVEVIERRVSRSLEPLTEKEVIKILNVSGGFQDILADRSRVYKEKIEPLLNAGEITVKELIQFIIKNPSVLRYPIIIDEKRCEIGYNDDNIRAFLPRVVKNQLFRQALDNAYDECFNNAI